MKYFAADIDSFLYFFRFGREALDHSEIVDVVTLEGCVSQERQVERIDLDHLGMHVPEVGMPGSLCPMVGEPGKRHILVSKNVNRHASDKLVRIQWGCRVPPGSFARISSGIHASTPEFIYLQLARKLGPIQLALAGCTLCAGYHLDANGKIVLSKPLTSVEMIERYLDGAKGIGFSDVARRTLSLVADNAESPQEVNSFLLTCLPCDLGGRGIKKLQLNYVIPALPEDGPILDRPDREFWRIDMGDKEAGVGSEYLGKHHETTVDEDRARLNALLAKKQRLLQVKHADLVEPMLAERHSNQLASLLDERLPVLTAEQQEERVRLRAFLFSNKRPCI